MIERNVLAAYRIVLATLALVAVVVQWSAASQTPAFRVANFFGYYTILGNVFAAVVLLVAAGTRGAPSHRLDLMRGAATLYLAMVGTIFSLLLAHLDSDLIGWVNGVVHYLMPVAVCLDWIADPPGSPIGVRAATSWLAFPLLYVAYTLVRGSIVHWYPYPFLNVDTNGWPNVAAWIGGLVVLTLLFATLVAAVGNALRARHDRPVNTRR